MSLPRLIHLLLSLASLLLTSVGSAQEGLRLGVAPHTSARVILEMYQPLRQHLEKALGQTVDLQTAPDFTEFARRALNHEYDLTITTGHQARLFQTQAGYVPLLTYQADFKAVALVPVQSRLQKPADLRGATVLGLSQTSLVTLWGQHWLRQNNLNDVTMRYVSAADSISRQVLAGDAALAFTSLANYQKLPREQQDALRIFAESEALVGRVYLLNKRQKALLGKFETALEQFAQSPAGKAYFEQNKLGGYRKLKPRELEAMEPFAAETLRELRAK